MKQLAQLRPSTTDAESLYSPSENREFSMRVINVCNVGATQAKVSVYHDKDGAVYDETTALVWQYTLLPSDIFQVEIDLSGDQASSNIGVQTSVADALNFTAYGEEVK